MQPKARDRRVIVLAILALAASIGALPTRAVANATADPVMVPPARLGDMRADPNADALPVGYVAPPAPRVMQGVKYGPAPSQIGDVYLPASGAKAAPVILFLHGGGWTMGTRNPVPQVLLRQVTRMHAPVMSIEYTLATTADPKTALPAAERRYRPRDPMDQDAGALLGRAASGNRHGALGRGQSRPHGGVGPGTFRRSRPAAQLAKTSPSVVGMGSFAGPVDIQSMDPIEGWDPHLDPYLGCTVCTPEQIAAANPLTYATESAPPAYLNYGADDWLIGPDVHGLPTAERLATERNESALPTSTARCGTRSHPTPTRWTGPTSTSAEFETWLDNIAAGKWPGTELSCARHKRSRRTVPCPT